MASHADSIARFWRFWTKNETRLFSDLEGDRFDPWISRISDAVNEIDPELGWEFGKGKVAKHYFCLSPNGGMDLRIVTESWLLSGPGNSENWEFYPAKPPNPGVRSTTVAGVHLDFDLTRVKVERAGFRLKYDVELYHPHWDQLDEGQRELASYIIVDSTLGEDGVERWIRSIDQRTDAFDEGMSLSGLRERVDELAAETGTHVVLKAKLKSGSPCFLSIDASIKRVDHLGLNAHLAVTIHFDGPRSDGLCDEIVAAQLNALEDELETRLGHHALHVGRRTFENQRCIHYRAAASGPAAQWAHEWAQKQLPQIEVEMKLDPQWQDMPW